VRHIHQLFTIVSILFLIAAGNTLTAETDSSESLGPGKATGRIKIDEQGFLIKHVYARKSIVGKEDKDKAEYVILLTNRPFPEDFSKIDRLDINRYVARYDLNGLIIGLDANRDLVFADILRVRSITGSLNFRLLSDENGVIEGRLFTNGQQQYFGLKYEIDVTFSAKL
jgi:hypothetical protein